MQISSRFFAGLVVSLFSLQAVAAANAWPEYRLPAGITPSAQHIELRLDPSAERYSGRVEITLVIRKAVERIGINQLGLTMQRIVLAHKGATRELAATESDWERSWLADGNKIPAGEYLLSIDFEGAYSTDSLGMHRVKFEDRDYVFTQMESMYARRAFPVFDEPLFKIPYQVTISAPAGLTVISNTPEQERSEKDGWQRVTFEKTPPMPSYLLAYAVGPLDRAEIKGLTVPGFVYTPKGHAGKVGFVLRETPTVVATLERYFGQKYPYQKLDFLAVPEFAFGAMENPGLITYRTDLLMVGDEVTGNTAEAVINVIAHEVAHIWYGDLVTMAWWDDLWLNEAFASWMARKVLVEAYPQYESSLKLPQSNAFAADQRTTSKAIRKTVRNEEEIFDGIGLNYTKGHAMLTMLEGYVGPDEWRQGILKYLEKFAWGNATESDLWAVISAESGVNVSVIASDYLNQPGFATVSIGDKGELRQDRFMVHGRKAADLQWHIPLNVKYKSDGEVRQTFALMKEKTGTLDVPVNSEWIFPDAGGNGYYRWAVSSAKFYNLVDDVDALTEREKIALLSNSNALLDAGQLSLSDYLFALNRLLADPHPLVFLPALESVKVIGENYVEAGNRARFSAFVDQAMSEQLRQIGLVTRKGDSEALQQMRPRLLRMLGQFGNDETVREGARALVADYFAAADSVQSGLAREAMRITALNGDAALYERYREAYLKSDSEDQKSNILSAVYFRDPDVIRRHLDFSISAAVPAGDAATAMTSFVYLLDDDTIVFEWLANNMDAFLAKVPSYAHAALPQIIGDTCSEDGLALLKNFFAERGDAYKVSLAKEVEATEACIDGRKRHASDMNQFLAQFDPR